MSITTQSIALDRSIEQSLAEDISMNQVECLVLAGGQGKRLAPLTQTLPKPLISFGGKYRLIDIPLSNAFHSGIQNVHVLTQYRACALNHYVSKVYSNRFQAGFVNTLSPEENLNGMSCYQGTADAVRKNLEYLEQTKSKYFLILSADHLYKINFKQMLSEALKSSADVMIATTQVNYEQSSRMGIIATDSSNKIINFCEKPTDIRKDPSYQIRNTRDQEVYLASMGIYLFKKEVLLNILKGTSVNDFGKDILPQIIHTHNTHAFQYKGYWADIGTISSFFDANIDLLQKQPNLSFYDDSTPIYFQHAPLPPTKILSGSLEKALTCDGSTIDGATIQNSLIGPKTYVGPSHVKDCYIIGGGENINLTRSQEPTYYNTWIGSGCQITKAIIDKNVTISDNVHLTNQAAATDYEDEYVSIKEGIIIVKKGAHLPKGYTI